MTDTPQYIKDLQLKLWLQKTPGQRLFQAIKDIDDMRKALIDAKKKLGLPLGDLDPMGKYQKNKQEFHEKRDEQYQKLK